MPRIEEELFEEKWDKKRVAIGLLCLGVLIAGGIIGKSMLAHYGIGIGPAVKGIQTTSEPQKSVATNNTTQGVKLSLPSTDVISQKVNDIQQQVTHLNIADVASSSPQIRQILQQLQALPQYPVTQAKQACMQLCSKI